MTSWEPDEMATPIEQLDAMRSLGENWDGYGGAPPDSKAIDLARDIVELIGKAPERNGETLHVSPTRTGGVLIEWEDRLREHEVEINRDGSSSFLYLNKTTGETASRRFSPDHSAVLVQEMKYLLAA